MTKHKKKKASKKPESEDSVSNDPPPTESVELESEKNARKKKLDKLFWLRVGLAIMGGIIATFALESIEGEERRWASIALLIVIFIISIGIAKGMRLNLPPSDRKKIVTTGIGSYIFMYLFIWILTYTLVHASDNGIPVTPFT